MEPFFSNYSKWTTKKNTRQPPAHSDKPKKTIKKKNMSTKAKIRKEKTLERGLMNSEKDVKRIDKHHEKISMKKRGKQMWE